MGLLDGFLQQLLKREIKQGVQKALSSLTIDFTPPPYVLEAAGLLKGATQAAKLNDFQTALQRYNEAVQLYTKHNDSPSIDILFRKSNYLYKAGMKEDAWDHLNSLRYFNPSDEGDIFDKMRSISAT